MRPILLAVIFFAIPMVAGAKTAQTSLAEVDAQFNKGLYNEALTGYESLAKSPKEEVRLKALYRAVECQALLFRYGEAAQRALSSRLPPDPVWRGRFLIQRAELAREFLRQYGLAAASDEAGDDKDIMRRTPQQWRQDAEESYLALWPLRHKLAQNPISQESYFVDLKGAQTDMAPTLWDFAALRWTDYLLTQKAVPSGQNPPFLSFIRPDYDRKFSPQDAAAAQAGAVMEESARLTGKDRAAARQEWRVRRLMIPFEHPDRVAPAPDGHAATNAAAAILKNWMDSFTEPPARAEAALKAARLLSADERYEETVALCRRTEKLWPLARVGRHCARIRTEIELPVLELTALFVPPPGKNAFKLRSRNLDFAHFRIFRLDPQEVIARGKNRPQDWSALRHPQRDLIEEYAARQPDFSWKTAISSHAPYAYSHTEASAPRLWPGIYLALASSDERFQPKSSLLSGAIVNITELFLIASAGAQGPERDFVFDPAGPKERTAPVFHFYALNALSGRPVSAEIDAFRREHRGMSGLQRLSLDIDASGMASVRESIPLIYGANSHASLDVLAKSGQSYAYPSQPVSFSHSVPQPIEVHLETDRPVYRPGQEVRVKITVLRRIPRGYKVYDGTAQVDFTARDANYQEIFRKTVKLNALGSAAVRFHIPTGRLLGNYRIQAILADFNRVFEGDSNFAVEEYKRPEFEVTVDESTGAWKFGQTAVVTGKARYYFGGPVPDAPVSYRIYREAYIPWFCWWWRGLSRGRAEVASGQVKTDSDGNFSVDFTPLPEDAALKDPWPASFHVEVESRDPGGRTIAGARSFRAGAKAYLFEISPESGFLSAGRPSQVPARLMNLNESAVSGAGEFELFQLKGRPKSHESEPSWAGYFPQMPSLENLYKEIPNNDKVAAGKLAFLADRPTRLPLGSLEPGAYRLTVRANDPWGGASEQSIILLCADKKGKLDLGLPATAIPEHASYLPGETARILLGSDHLESTQFVEIWGGEHLLQRLTLPGGVRLLDVPVTEDHKGGFTVRWFGARDFKIRCGQANIDVPWKDRELSVKIDYDKVIKPGQKVSWTVSVKDNARNPVDGEAAVRVFDRSLEYYASAAKSWLAALYGARSLPANAQGSLFRPNVHQIPVEEGWIKKMLDLFHAAVSEPQPPTLRLCRGRVPRRRGPRFLAEGGEFSVQSEAASVLADGGSAPQALAKSLAEAAPPAPQAVADTSVKESPETARSDFSETACFEPQLKIAGGKGLVSFQAPEQLTSWKIQASVITRDVKRGILSAEAVTRKDLMVRVDMPRFYREGDQGEIKAVVHNGTGSEISGEATLSVTEDGKPAAEKLGLKNLSRSFTVKPHGLSPLTWTLSAPIGQTSFKVRAVARSAGMVDAEQRDLPILPSRQRLVETTLVSLDGTSRQILKLARFAEPDKTRVNESMTLQIDPQLALSILNSLPYLVHYPHECSEQVLNRYVPLAIANAFYRKNPKLAEAVKKIPKRDTITPAWDRNDPRRLMSLMETPWEQISQGRKSSWPLIDMFDPVLVRAELNDALAKLQSAQNPDGGYPWFPGGRSDPYITLLILSGFAEAQSYAVEIPLETTRRALHYVNNEIPKHLKPEPGEVSLLLYAAYVVTSYPKSWPESALGYRFAKSWADYGDRHADAMTALGKAMAASCYRRLGEKAKGDLYLARALDGSREDPVAGVYWTPEKISWLWYNDTVEKHAFMLRTLLAVKPKDPRIPGLVQWLLFNRKGNEWKSTKASAAAIYSLLDVLKSRGALDAAPRNDEFIVQWGPDLESATVAPWDWLEKPLRWTRVASAIGPRHGAARIEKQGPGLAFASLTWIYSTDQPAPASAPGLMNLERRFFLRHKEGQSYRLSPLKAGDTVAVGDQIEVQLKLETRSQFEYVHLKDPKPAGFEAEQLRSGWKWDNLSRYEEPRDSLTNFFMDWVPHGEYVLRYRLRPTTPGSYRLGAAIMQSMYAPEISARSDGFSIAVRP